MPDPSFISPTRVERTDPLRSSFLNQIANAIVQRIHVIGGRASRIGTNIMIDVTSSSSQDEFDARISGITAIINDAKWSYSFVEVSLDGNDTIDTNGGRTDTIALNRVENNNTGTSGVGGDGVNMSGDDYPSGFTRQPIPIGAVVRMTETVDINGNIAYVFSQVNVHDGTCT